MVEWIQRTCGENDGEATVVVVNFFVYVKC